MGCNLWMIGYLESLLGLALPMHEAPLGLASGVRPFSSFLASLAAAERVRSAGELDGRRKGIGACRRESARVTTGFAPSPPYICSPLPLFSAQQPFSAAKVKSPFFLPLFFLAQFVESIFFLF
jgi:hypothetical protein